MLLRARHLVPLSRLSLACLSLACLSASAAPLSMDKITSALQCRSVGPYTG